MNTIKADSAKCPTAGIFKAGDTVYIPTKTGPAKGVIIEAACAPMWRVRTRAFAQPVQVEANVILKATEDMKERRTREATRRAAVIMAEAPHVTPDDAMRSAYESLDA